MSRSTRFVLSLSILALASCKPAPKLEGPVFKEHDTKSQQEMLSKSGISTASYRLRDDLSFSDAEVLKLQEVKTRKNDPEIISRTLAFVNTRRLTVEEATKHESYCELTTLTSENEPAQNLRFARDSKLVASGFYTFSDKLIGSVFSLVLKSSDTKSLTLRCWNTLNLEQVRAHVGHILEISAN